MKLNKYFPVLVLLLTFKVVLPQTGKIDSLTMRLETATGEDYINTLNELGIANWNTDPLHSVRYGKHAIAKAERDGVFTFYARSHNVIGAGYLYLDQYDSSIFFYRKAKDIAKQDVENPRMMTDLTNAYTNLWSVLNAAGNPDEAFKEFDNYISFIRVKNNIDDLIDAQFTQVIHYRSAGFYHEAISVLLEIINYAENSSADEIQLKAENEMGICYFFLGNYDKALEIFILTDSALSRYTGFNTLKMQVKSNISAIYMANEDYANALVMLKQVNMLSEKIGYVQGLGASYANTGIAFKFLNEYDSALSYYNKSLKIADAEEYDFYKMAAHANIGEVYEIRGNLKLAMNHFRKSLEASMLDPYYTTNALVALARGNLKLGNYPKSDSLLKAGFDIIKNNNMPERLKEAYHVKYLYDSSTANYQEALKDYILYSEIKDSLLSMEKQKNINSLQAKYQLNEKEQKIKIQALEIANHENKFRWMVYLVVLVGFLIILIILYLATSKKKLLLKKELEIQNHKLTLLTNQINEHFVSNSIARIYSLIDMDKVIEAKKYAAAFIRYLREHIIGLSSINHSLHDELKLISLYFDLQRQQGKSIELVQEIDPNVDIQKVLVPHFLLQPLIENAIQHGFSEKNLQIGIITIKVSSTRKGLQISIHDNGKGMDAVESTHLKRKGIGIDNIRKRLKLIHKQNNIEITRSESGTIVNISLNL